MRIEDIDEKFIVQFVKDHPLPKEWHETKKEELLKEIAWYLENNPKYVIDYSNDPPFDSSGELRQIADHFLLSLYDTVEDFLEEYSGRCDASYSSGRGWNYLGIDAEIGDEDYHLGWIYANYYFELLKKEYECVDNGDENDNWGDLWDNLTEYNFKLNEEIDKTKLIDVYKKYSKQNELFDYDKKPLRDMVLKIIKNCDEESEVWITRDYPEIPVFDFGGQLKRIIDLDKYDTGVQSKHDEFHYRLNQALAYDKSVAVMVETPKESGAVEIRGVLIEHGTIKDISANDLKEFYSIDAETGEKGDPPENCVFMQFNIDECEVD